MYLILEHSFLEGNAVLSAIWPHIVVHTGYNITELKPLFNRSNSFVISNSGGNSVVSAAAKLVFNDADEFVGGHQAPLPPPLPPKTERPPLPPKQRIR